MIFIENKKYLKEQVKIMTDRLKLIANENKLMTICFLAETEKALEKLTSFLKISQPVVSQMLLKMKDEGIIIFKKLHTKIFSRIENKEISKLIKDISKFCNNIQK